MISATLVAIAAIMMLVLYLHDRQRLAAPQKEASAVSREDWEDWENWRDSGIQVVVLLTFPDKCTFPESDTLDLAQAA